MTIFPSETDRASSILSPALKPSVLRIPEGRIILPFASTETVKTTLRKALLFDVDMELSVSAVFFLLTDVN